LMLKYKRFIRAFFLILVMGVQNVRVTE